MKGNTKIESLDVFLHFFAATGVPENSMPNLKSLSVQKAWYDTTASADNACALNAMKLSSNIVRLRVFAKLNPATLLQIPVLCPHITSLALSFSDVSDAVLRSITAACPHIVHLDLHRNHELTDTGILSVAKNLKRLQCLNILDIPALTDASLKHIYTHCANTLHTLFFGSCNDGGAMFGAEAVNTLLQRCTLLRVVRFEEDHYMEPVPEGIDLLPAVFEKLTTLIMLGVTCEKTLPIVARYATNLQKLYIADFTHLSLMPLWNGCPSLTELHVCFKTNEDWGDDWGNDYGTFARFAVNTWMKVRPGLLILRYTEDQWNLKVTEMF